MTTPKTSEVSDWFEWLSGEIATEVTRLWPEETEDAHRGACIAEEAGEVNRAITKRRHARYAEDGLCKGLTVDQWTDELKMELTQLVGVILDLAHREGFDLIPELVKCLVILELREKGS